ncbi:MAG TPA: lipid-A-disaccharide synthase [Saprospiraceae bacterium]|nr:lipid-A-disaccharide synthase [Saprospiraceae bacterium]
MKEAIRCYIISGEPSGEKYGAWLMHHLKMLNPEILFRYWGGDEMQKTDPNIAMHISQTSFMGFAEVVRNLNQIKSLFDYAKKDILAFRPHFTILIDYPGFNLRMAKWLKKRDIKVFYYVAPQVWAWKESRTNILKKYVDLLICILPFEQEYFSGKGIHFLYTGHPLMEILGYEASETKPLEAQKGDKPVLALFPGSRRQEIKKHMPVMLKAALRLPQFRIVISKIKHIEEEYYQATMVENSIKDFQLTENNIQLLKEARIAAVASGTATLEAAILDVPQVVVYKTSLLSYLIGKALIRTPFISLVNLIAGRKIVDELIQKEVNPANLSEALLKVEGERHEVIREYQSVKNILGKPGASMRAASAILGRYKEFQSQ